MMQDTRPQINVPETISRTYRNETAMRALNVLVEPTMKHLLSMTRIHSSLECWALAVMCAQELAYSPEVVSGRVKVTEIFREAYLMGKRSLESKMMIMTGQLAQEQLVVENESKAEQLEL